MTRGALAAGAAGLALLGATASWAGDARAPTGQGGPVPACPAPDGPPAARPGECYAKVRTPPRYETYTETEVVAPARRESRVIPATFETVDQPVLVSPERVERTSLPPTYRTVFETVVVQPGGVRLHHEEAVYRTVVETVMVRPARTEWRRQFTGPGGFSVGYGQPTGEIMCLVEIPAAYERVERRVLVRPARSFEVQVPPVTRQVARQVVDQPGRVVERVIPAVWRTERVRRMVTPERTQTIDIPAVTRPVTRQRMVSPGAEAWRRIDCPPPPPGVSQGERG